MNKLNQLNRHHDLHNYHDTFSITIKFGDDIDKNGRRWSVRIIRWLFCSDRERERVPIVADWRTAGNKDLETWYMDVGIDQRDCVIRHLTFLESSRDLQMDRLSSPRTKAHVCFFVWSAYSSCWHNACLMLDQRRRRWSSIEPALCQRLEPNVRLARYVECQSLSIFQYWALCLVFIISSHNELL